MSLGKMLVEQLKARAAESTRAEHATITVAAEVGSTHANVVVADFDRYSAALQTLTIGAPAEVGEDARAFLSAKAAGIVQQLSYLEEPLAVWELDVAERTTQLRSSPPQREGEEVSYWEVVLHASELPAASLARYRWAPGMVEREQVVYPATFALIGRLADSMALALAE